MTPASKGKSSIGLDQNVAAALVYALGFLGGILFLMIEKRNRFVRFHAMQSALVFGVIGVISLMLSSLSWVGRALTLPFMVGVVLLWLVLMAQAINGRTYRLPLIGEWAETQLGN